MMIPIVSAMFAWMAFYLSWQMMRGRAGALRCAFSSLYALATAFLVYGLSVNHYFGRAITAGHSPPEEVVAIVARARPSIIAGDAILFATVAWEIVMRRRKKVTPNGKGT